jgi:hypothetical protein
MLDKRQKPEEILVKEEAQIFIEFWRRHHNSVRLACIPDPVPGVRSASGNFFRSLDRR